MQLYRASHEVAGDPLRYSEMSRQASVRLREFSSVERVADELQRFLAQVSAQSASVKQCGGQ